MHPSISVLVSAYGPCPYLPEALESLAGQSTGLGDLQVVLLTDRARGPSAALSNVPSLLEKVVPEPHRGRFFAEGLRSCSGDLVCCLNDDDVWRPDKLARIREAFDREPSLALHHHQVEFFGREPVQAPRLRRIHGLQGEAPVWVHRGPSGWTREVGRYDLGFNDSSLSFRRGLLERSLPYLERIDTCEDSFFLFCALARGALLCADPRVLGRYRIHPANVSQAGGVSARAGRAGLQREFVKRSAAYAVMAEMARDLAPDRPEVGRMAQRGQRMSQAVVSLTTPEAAAGERLRRGLDLLARWDAYEPALDLSLALLTGLSALSRGLALELVFRGGIRTAV